MKSNAIQDFPFDFDLPMPRFRLLRYTTMATKLIPKGKRNKTIITPTTMTGAMIEKTVKPYDAS
jgi:hypothetical protein